MNIFILLFYDDKLATAMPSHFPQQRATKWRKAEQKVIKIRQNDTKV
jgi:hypothetical protein